MKAILALLLFVAQLAFAAPPALTWSLYDRSPQLIVNGATVTRSSPARAGAWATGLSETPQSIGVRTVRMHVDYVGSLDGTGPGMWVGVQSGQGPTNNYSGSTVYGVSYDARGRVLKNALSVTNPPPYGTGDIVGIRVDFTAKTVQFNKNDGAWSASIDITSLLPDVYITASLGSDTTPPTVTIISDDWNDYRYPTINVVAHGDSMTSMIGINRTYHDRLLEMLGEGSRVEWARGQRFGIPGDTWGFGSSVWVPQITLTQDALIRVDPAKSPSLPNWLILFAGTNGLSGFHRTPAQEYTDFQTYLNARLAAGWQADHIVVLTVLPRSTFPESTRTAYNDLVVGGAATYGYRLARVDLDPNIGVAGANLNLAYYQADQLHPNDAGDQILAQIIYGAMFP